MGFKVIVDTLASLAAFVAILSVLFGWYSSARKPLSISRVVVHKKDDGLTYIIVTKNRKSYPVETKRIDCFSKKSFEIEERVGESPNTSRSYLADMLCSRQKLHSRCQRKEISIFVLRWADRPASLIA